MNVEGFLKIRELTRRVNAATASRLNMPSFIDLLDRPIAAYDPKEAKDGRITPPRGILNSPYGMDGSDDSLDLGNVNYDTYWSDQLSNPVPGAGVYLGLLHEPNKTPKDRNVVYISRNDEGDTVVKALPYNRLDKKIALQRSGQLEKPDIILREGFGDQWVNHDEGMEGWKKLAKERLDAKIELDKLRELRFAEEVKDFWRLRR
jgi:hypothetical protein